MKDFAAAVDEYLRLPTGSNADASESSSRPKVIPEIDDPPVGQGSDGSGSTCAQWA